MAQVSAQVSVQPPQNQPAAVKPPQPKPFSARLIHITGDDAQVGVTNNLKTSATINKIFYISTADGNTVEGSIENPGGVRPGEERRFTVSVPETLDSSALTCIKLTIYGETHGVHLIGEITICC